MVYNNINSTVFFVCHMQPEHIWEDDRSRPLTAERKADCKTPIYSKKRTLLHRKKFKGKIQADKK